MTASTFTAKRRYLLTGVVFAVALYVLLPQIGGFRSSWTALGQADFTYVWLAVAATGLTYVFAAATYYLLAFKRLIYRRIVIIQLAAMFLNRLLPAGVGALGTNYAYLSKQKHNGAQAAAVVAVNNLLGAAGHALLAVLIIGLLTSDVSLTSGYHVSARMAVLYAVALAGLAGLLLVVFGRHRITAFLSSVRKQLVSYRRRKLRLGLALLSSMALTLTNVLALYLCTQALGVELNLSLVFIVFTLGVGLGTAVPTPGGLGGFEAGLLAGFVAYDVDSGRALAIALLYRFITYWLAIVGGALAFAYAERRHYI